MQHLSPQHIKKKLFSTIESLRKRSEDFIINPQVAFTRTKKISFIQVFLFAMLAGSDNTASQLLDCFDEKALPLPSAMIQRRNQIKKEAFLELFSQFTNKINAPKSFGGYQLIACDGSRINLPYNPSDPDTFIQCIAGRKGINQIHMNALYDPLNDIFLDIILQGVHQLNEKEAFVRFLDKYAQDSRKRIFLADRGYASYNIFAHAIHNRQKFLIRLPEGFAKRLCNHSSKWLEPSSVDQEITICLGRRNTAELRKSENYHCIAKKGRYDFITPGSNETDRLKFRVLKFKIAENTYEYIATNLPKYAFPMRSIKSLYHLRWGEETAFRHLKYAGNMVHIHSLKKEFLIQEIYAKLTMYNFSSWISSAVSPSGKDTEKYHYVVNHTQVQKICIRFLRGTIKDVAAIILRFMIPVRPGRRYERCLRRQAADTLSYR